MFALSHHIIVKYAASQVGFNQFEDYALLGDDIVIANQLVADEYTKVIKALGVEISDSKSHRGNKLLDFTKRLWLRKENEFFEITGVPLAGLFKALGNPFLISLELAKCLERGTLDNTNVPVSTSLLLFFQE